MATPPPGGRHRRAFTLVELLVVVAIVAVLTGLLLPALSRARERAASTRCLSNLHQIGVAVAAYENANRWAFPIPSHSLAQVSWLDGMVPYGATQDCRTCPDDRRLAAGQRPATSYALSDYTEDPLEPGTDYDPVTGQTLPGGRSATYVRVTQVARSTAVAFVVESYAGDHVHTVGVVTPAGLAAEVDVARHGGGRWANYLFVDGHAAPIAWSEIRRTFSATHDFMNPEAAP